MPTEAEMRANSLVQYTVGDEVVWYDADNQVFCAAEADSGDAGDAFATYDELVESLG